MAETLEFSRIIQGFWRLAEWNMTKQELLEKLGQIFWLICQAKPWLRGDPSIAEMFIKVVWMHKTGELLPSWKQGVVPWESVIESTNPKDYGKNFRCLFSHSPY